LKRELQEQSLGQKQFKHMPKTIIANWKMRLSIGESLALAKKMEGRFLKTKNQIIICPDFLSLPLVSVALKNSPVFIGGQDCAEKSEGSMTGEVSPANLKEAGATYVILGHSERRSGQKEDGKIIASKIKAAISAGLKPVFCVGESAAQKKKGESLKVISNQLEASLKGLNIKNGGLLVAYEPVWAIGAGKPMGAKEADETISKIASICVKILGKKVPVLYGGSVEAANAKDFLKKKNIAGLLVGGASLEAEEFSRIAS